MHCQILIQPVMWAIVTAYQCVIKHETTVIEYFLGVFLWTKRKKSDQTYWPTTLILSVMRRLLFITSLLLTQGTRKLIWLLYIYRLTSIDLCILFNPLVLIPISLHISKQGQSDPLTERANLRDQQISQMCFHNIHFGIFYQTSIWTTKLSIKTTKNSWMWQ